MIRQFCAATLAALFATASFAEEIKLAVTTSFENSGLSEVLLPAIREDIALEVQLLVVGTGQAIRLGQAGDVDAILVHSRSAEEAFVADGYGTHRREIMYNDFVIIGPFGDPANVTGSETAVAALEQIAKTQPPFVSRGDDSGTHKKEVALWAEIGGVPSGKWYRAVGAGMGAALNTAAGLNAYIIADRASWLNFGNKAGLALLFEGDPVLFNQYAFLPVNPDRHDHVKIDQALLLEEWLVGPRAQGLIENYTIDGENLFVFNAKPSG